MKIKLLIKLKIDLDRFSLKIKESVVVVFFEQLREWNMKKSSMDLTIFNIHEWKGIRPNLRNNTLKMKKSFLVRTSIIIIIIDVILWIIKYFIIVSIFVKKK